MLTQAASPIVCLFLIQVVADTGVHFVMERNPNNYFCGSLKCVADIPDSDNEVASFVDMTIYDITSVNSELKLASVARFQPDLYVDTTKSSATSCTGVISGHQANLTVQLRHDIDCLYGIFKCQLNLVTVSGRADVVTEIVIPEQNNSNYSRIADLSTRFDRLEGLLGDLSVRADNQTAELKRLADIVDKKLLPQIEQTTQAFNCSPDPNGRNQPEIQPTIASTAPAQTGTATCNPGWYQFGDICIIFTNETKDWLNAMTTCIEYSARLLNIESQEKHDWIVHHMKKLNLSGIWIGGLMISFGNWKWFPSFNKIEGYTNWGQGQPDNPTSEKCLYLCSQLNYKWNDGRCDRNRGFACEKSVAL